VTGFRISADTVKRGLPITTWLPEWRSLIRADVLAALAVWAVLVPQSLAYASLAGLPAKHGLYAAGAAMLAYAVFGTSRQLNVGPSSAVAVLSAATVAPIAAGDPKRFVTYSAALALVAGAILVAAGLARMGFVSDFIARPVLAGYLVGLAVVITVSQLPKLLGVPAGTGNVFEQLRVLVRSLDDASGITLAIGLGSLAFMLVLRRVAPLVPAALIVVVASIVLSEWVDLADEGVAVVGTIPTSLPSVALPIVSAEVIGQLLAGAAGVALLAYAESIAGARTFAEKHEYEIDPNRELVALGASNVAAGMVQGFPVDASVSRSVVGDGAGQRSQLASLVNVALVVATVLLLARFFSELPQPTLGAIVIAAVIPLLDPRPLTRLWRLDQVDAMLGVVCFVGVLTAGVLKGIVVAVICALVALVYRSFRPNMAVLGRARGTPEADEDVQFHDVSRTPGLETYPGLVIFRFDQEVFFANAPLFERSVLALLTDQDARVQAVLVDAGAISHVDTTGIAMLENLHERLSRAGVSLLLARPRAPLREILERSGLLELIGPENVFPSIRLGVRAHLAGAAEPDSPSHSEDDGT
jgi:SulP family sulfate permease